MTRATQEESNVIYKKKIMEVNDEVIEALKSDDPNKIKRLMNIMSYMMDKYTKSIK